MGWYDAGGGVQKSGPFCNGNGVQVTFDVRLDGTGKPIDSNFKVLKEDGVSTAAAVTPIGIHAPSNLVVEASYSTAKQKTLVWRGKRRIPFTGLI
jgi:vacuolar-type H+-ATPase subunit B/Vma2